MKYTGGVDIDNNSTEVAIADVSPGGEVRGAQTGRRKGQRVPGGAVHRLVLREGGRGRGSYMLRNIVFNIPVGLGVIETKDRKYLGLGILAGVIVATLVAPKAAYRGLVAV